MTQKALIVHTQSAAGGATLADLNEHLRAGWRVVQATPMGSGGDGFAALVVVEQAAATEAEALLDQIEEEMEGDGAADEVQDPLLRRLRDDE